MLLAEACLDDKEKARLAHNMANGPEADVDPGQDDDDAVGPARRRGGGETGELERMFERVLDEVATHKRSLQEALEQRSPEAAQAKRRLAAAMADLKAIDNLLRTG